MNPPESAEPHLGTASGERAGESDALRRRRYWRSNLRLISILLLLTGAVTFGVAWRARELSAIDFLGWPLSYWVGAQGALIGYLVAIIVYSIAMNRRDERLRAEAGKGDR